MPSMRSVTLVLLGALSFVAAQPEIEEIMTTTTTTEETTMTTLMTSTLTTNTEMPTTTSMMEDPNCNGISLFGDCCPFGLDEVENCATVCDNDIYECPVTETTSSMMTMTTSEMPVMTTPAATKPAKTFGVITTAVKGVPTGLVEGGETWGYAGCVTSDTFGEFVLLKTSDEMDVELCLEAVAEASSEYLYAGLNGVSCYAAMDAGENTNLTETSFCDTPCPGDASEFCGGTPAKRQVGAFLSLYVQTFEQVPAPVDNGAPLATPAVYQAGDIYINVSVINYIGLCGCEAGLGPLNWTTTRTLTACGCPTEAAQQAVPMITTATYCAVCGPTGGGATVTLTVPAGAPLGATPMPKAPISYNAASNPGEGKFIGSCVGALAFVGGVMALL